MSMSGHWLGCAAFQAQSATGMQLIVQIKNYGNIEKRNL